MNIRLDSVFWQGVFPADRAPHGGLRRREAALRYSDAGDWKMAKYRAASFARNTIAKLQTNEANGTVYTQYPINPVDYFAIFTQ